MIRVFLLLCVIGLCYGGPKIIGGSEANITDVPYQAGVLWRGLFSCGGVVLTENIVLTAGWCIWPFPAEDMQVHTGSSLYFEGGHTFGVSKIVYHPKFEPTGNNVDYDMAALYLNGTIVFDESTQPIQLAPSLPEVDSEVQISGWGTTLVNGVYPNRYLRKAVLYMEDMSVCEGTYTEWTPRLFCTRSGASEDSCLYDTGSPVTSNGVLIGMVSRKLRTCASEHPALNINVVDPEARQFISYVANV